MANQQNIPQNKDKQPGTPGQQKQFDNQNDQTRQTAGQRDKSGLQQPGRDRDLDEQNQRKDQGGRKSDR